MLAAKISPTVETFNILISAPGIDVNFQLKLLQQMAVRKIAADRFTYNLIIVGFMKVARCNKQLENIYVVAGGPVRELRNGLSGDVESERGTRQSSLHDNEPGL